MTILDTFDGLTPELILPRDFAKAVIPDFPKTMLISWTLSHSALLQQSYGGQVIHTYNKTSYPADILRICGVGQSLGYTCVPVGAPVSVAIMEELSVYGAKRFLCFGTCGVLQQKIAEGQLIVPTEAYRDEGTSYHYLPASDYVGVRTARELSRLMRKLNYPHLAGRVWTTDGFYRETRANFEKRAAEGCLAVDMECAALAAAANYRGFEYYHFLYGADCLDGDAWDHRAALRRTDGFKQKIVEIALALAIELEKAG